MKEEITGKKLRSFGLTVGGVFTLIAAWPALARHDEPRWWIAAIAAFFLLPALIFPKSLLWVHKGWMAAGYVIGWINTRIILGILRSWMGKDPMGRKLRPDLDTYRIVRKPRPASHLTKQY